MGDIAYFIVSFVSALVPTFLIGRLVLLVLGRYLERGEPLAIIANFGSLAVLGVILWPTGSFSNFGLYVVPQAVWLAIDLFHLRKKDLQISN
jgi:hypothetical protein